MTPEEGLAELLPCEHHAGARRECGEQVELDPGQLEPRVPTDRFAGFGIDPEIQELAPTIPGRNRASGDGQGRPTKDCSNAGDQLARLERLGDVVVRADLETGDPVDELVAGSQHDDGRHRTADAELAQDIEPGASRQHHVEDDEIGTVCRDAIERGRTIGGRDDLVALAGKVRADDLDDMRLVVNDQDSCHGLEDTRGPDRSDPALVVTFGQGRPGPCGPVPPHVPVPVPLTRRT